MGEGGREGGRDTPSLMDPRLLDLELFLAVAMFDPVSNEGDFT